MSESNQSSYSRFISTNSLAGRLSETPAATLSVIALHLGCAPCAKDCAKTLCAAPSSSPVRRWRRADRSYLAALTREARAAGQSRTATPWEAIDAKELTEAEVVAAKFPATPGRTDRVNQLVSEAEEHLIMTTLQGLAQSQSEWAKIIDAALGAHAHARHPATHAIRTIEASARMQCMATPWSTPPATDADRREQESAKFAYAVMQLPPGKPGSAQGFETPSFRQLR